MLEWFNSYPTNRYQFVYINGILLEQDMIKCGVPQGSILGPLLFLIYINDLSNITDFATTRMYADDANMTFTACSVEGLRHEMNADIEKLKQWLCANKLTLNILKTEYMLIGSRQRIATVTESLDLSINGISLNKVNCSKCLGVELDEFLSWDSHITSVCKKVSSGIGVIKPFIPSRSLINIYQSIVEPYFDYCSIVWNNISEGLAEKFQKLQNRAARIIKGSHYSPGANVRNTSPWEFYEASKPLV